MNTSDNNKDALRWDMTAWLRVFLWTAAIFATVPVARRVQRYVYDTIGKEFFTYGVLFIFISLLVALVYFLLFRSTIKSAPQYAWLAVSAGAYIYTTLQLRQHPEEAVHLLQFGLLSYFLYRALSHRIRDWTVYITTLLFVLFIGTLDEFIQWITPERIWSYKDIGINAVAGVYFVLAVSKGIKPETVRGPVNRFSVSMLAGIITVNLLFLGLCLSNTPEAVKHYTSVFPGLSWLAQEETMTEYGYRHEDPDIGTIMSRLSMEELNKIDSIGGRSFNTALPDNIHIQSVSKELFKTYNTYTDKYSYEFLLHVARRDNELNYFTDTLDQKGRLIAFKENLILEKYFSSTLGRTPYKWTDEKTALLGNTSDLRDMEYTSKSGNMITSFGLITVWAGAIGLTVIVWACGAFWKKRLNDCRTHASVL